MWSLPDAPRLVGEGAMGDGATARGVALAGLKSVCTRERRDSQMRGRMKSGMMPDAWMKGWASRPAKRP